jgi:hypothetical protein
MDSKPEGSDDKNRKLEEKRSGPPAPAPPPPLQPMKLPDSPAAKGKDDDPDDIGGPLVKKLASKVVDDGDVIEKDWVSKVKQIVGQYRDDPYKQSEELTLLRTNYMQRRYSKTIKLSK